MNRKPPQPVEEQPLDTVKEFQRRRRLATKLGGPFLASTFVCAAAIVLLINIDAGSPILRATLFLILGFAAVISWVLHLYFETKYARCPNCESLPINSRGDIDFDPVVCPKCGARLREYTSLFD